jgi:hypothetical protein
MKIRRLDSSGHTEIDCSPADVISALEVMMNSQPNRFAVAVKEPGKDETITKDIQGIGTLDPDTEITLIPSFIGG